jgi:general secretion pathway protein E
VIHQEGLVLAEGLSREFLSHRQIAPWRFDDDGALVVAATADALLDDLEEMGILYGAPVVLERASREDVEQLIERLASATEGRPAPVEGDSQALDEELEDARNLIAQAPVVRYVSLVVREAFDAGASDVHLESTRAGLTARLRIDGVLVPAQAPPSGLQHAVVSRIKLMARLDIAERRRPQDGRFRLRLASQELDLRVSTVPTLFGESVVLRLLERGGRPVRLAELGLEESKLAAFRRLVSRPHGLVLVTGPTGSGKTTTLYGALLCRNAAAEKIITLEDPIEYELPGITQVQIRPESGGFATALRSILRQDPDVLMIGEMRDRETATLAIQAAMTGHLVLATLHTSDATGAIPRLLDLGVPGYLVAATLDAVLAQRLVRRVCDLCREPYRPPLPVLAAMGDDAGGEFARGRGCSRCHRTGYRGRVGLFELLEVTDEMREVVAAGPTRARLRDVAARAGLRPLRSDGWKRARAGLTTPEEVIRVAD